MELLTLYNQISIILHMLKWIFALPVFGLLAFSARDNALSLEQALAEKKVELSVLPYHSYEGDGIKIKVKNLTKKSLKLRLTRGSAFVPDEDDEQTLINSNDELFALEGGAFKNLQFFGYCTELTDRSPGMNSSFTFRAPANLKLQRLLHVVDSLKIKDQGTIQHAIWCVTNNENIGYVGTDNPATTKALRSTLCQLTGQKDVWYHTRSAIRQVPGERMTVVPKVISGDISFIATEPVVIKGVIKDSTGKVLVTNPNTMSCPKGKVTFEFKMQIQGWAPGTYYVVYTNNDNELINQEFKL